MKHILFSLLISASAFATEGDLVLAGEKWKSTFKNYNCAAFGAAVSRPASHEALDVVFETVTTDSTLDNGLLKATFKVEGKTCRYNAFLLADNAAATIRLVSSKAYAPAEDADCAAGKQVLDAELESNNYLYWGHPHNLTIMVPSTNAREVCGGDFLGVNFVVTGRVR